MELNSRKWSETCAVALLPLLWSCGGPGDFAGSAAKNPGAVSPQEGVGFHAGPACDPGLAAFTQRLHAPILRQACVGCHDVDGIGPAHSVADPAASYAMIKSYVSFSQPERSRIMYLVRSKHWANYDPNAQGVSEETMREALHAWWEQGEKQCPDASTPQSSGAAIPRELPMFPSESFVKLEWAVDSWGAPFLGSRFSLEIQRLAVPTPTSKGAYVLRRPRLATPQGGVSLDGIRFFLNAKSQESANAWEHIDARIAGHPPDRAPVLSGQNLILIQDQTEGDMLSVAVLGAQFGDVPKCGALTLFQNQVLPAIRRSSCVGCHSSAPSILDLDGRARLDLSGTDEQVCAAVRERMSFARAEASPFFLIGFLEAYGHPPVGPIPAGLTQRLREWGAAEASIQGVQ